MTTDGRAFSGHRNTIGYALSGAHEVGTFHGLRVLTSEWLTVPGEPIDVRRSWRERLLSRPWRPMQATRTVIPQIPSKTVVRIGPNTIVVHPQTLEELRRQLEAGR